jgi:hypothetical protein
MRMKECRNAYIKLSNLGFQIFSTKHTNKIMVHLEVKEWQSVSTKDSGVSARGHPTMADVHGTNSLF